MYDHLATMGRTLTVPSVPLTPLQELQATPQVRKKRSGYGPIERIGQKIGLLSDCVYDVPFLRPNPHVKDENAFWTLPSDVLNWTLPAGAVVAPQDVPPGVLNVGYSTEKSTNRIPKAGNKSSTKKTTPKRRRNRKDSETEEEDHEYEDLSMSESEEGEDIQYWFDRGIPESWDPLPENLEIGSFLVTEDVYEGKSSPSHGISVSEVLCCGAAMTAPQNFSSLRKKLKPW